MAVMMCCLVMSIPNMTPRLDMSITQYLAPLGYTAISENIRLGINSNITSNIVERIVRGVEIFFRVS